MPKLTASAKLFIGLVAVAGLGTMVTGLMRWDCKDLARFFSFLIVAALASRLKLKLPGVNGSMSVNVPFLLIAVVELSWGEAVVLAAVCAVVQCLPAKGKSLLPVQVLFNVSTLLMSIGVAELVYRSSGNVTEFAQKALLVTLAGAAYLVSDSLPVAVVISLTEKQNLVKTWHEIFRLTFPYFGFSAVIAAVVIAATRLVGWQIPLLVLPVMALTYHSYKKYFSVPVDMAAKVHTASAAD